MTNYFTDDTPYKNYPVMRSDLIFDYHFHKMLGPPSKPDPPQNAVNLAKCQHQSKYISRVPSPIFEDLLPCILISDIISLLKGADGVPGLPGLDGVKGEPGIPGTD